ncbi:MAG: dihydrolipoyl dehydrogenase, partial [Nitrospirae bacterium]
VGGTCLNRGCIPTKAMLASSELYEKIKRADEFGISIDGTVTADLARIVSRKQKVIQTQIKGIKGLFRSWGVVLKHGRGRIVSERKIKIEADTEETIEVDRIIIATGSRPAELPLFPFDGDSIISSTEALELKEIPRTLVIIGAGVIGCEFATLFRALGSEVTLVELMPRALTTEDEEISRLLERELKKKKIKLITDVRAERVQKTRDGIHIGLSNGKEIVADKVLVSIGRKLNSDGIGLEEIGVETGQRGEIKVDERLQTNVPGIYAVGDVTGGPMLAHVASREGLVAAINATGGDIRMDYSVVPSAIFTSPEIGSVGLREQEAKERGIPYQTGHFQFRTLGKAHAMGEISGLIKIIADPETDKILGGHIIGPHASDLIHEIAVSMKNGVTIKGIAETIHAHPTLSEGIMEASEDVHGEAIHVPKG